MAKEIRATTGLLALLGHPVEHSLSPQMQNAALEALEVDLVYLAFSVSPAHLGEAVAGLKALGFRGGNVTVPHKEAVIKYLDIIEMSAARIGAVNTIVNEGGRLHGYNTDASGFLRSLKEAGFDPAEKRVVLLGAGGAARAVAFALVEAGCRRLTIANRTLERAYRLAGILTGMGAEIMVCPLEERELQPYIEEAHLILNATSLGLEGGEPPPFSPERLSPGQWVYDLVYNPPLTPFLQKARERGCHIISGWKMLLYQGAEAFSLWTGRPAPLKVMEEALRKFLPGI